MRRRVISGVLVLLVATVGWLAFRGYQLRSELLAAKTTLTGLSGALLDDDSARLDRDLDRAERHVSRARSVADDPIWRAAAALPVLGRSFAFGRDATAVAQDLLTKVVPPAQQALDLVRAKPLLQQGVVDVDRVAAMAEPVSVALERATAVQQDARALATTWLPGPVAEQERDLTRQVDRLVAALRSAKATIGIAPAMLGADGPRRYFLAVQNNAEVRGTGGIIGAYAVLRADKGRLSRERVGTDRDFVEQDKPVVDLGSEYAAQYDPQSGRTYWTASVITPDWPSAAQVVAGLWKAQGGGQIDGVIGVDPVSMAELLRATGPVTFDGRTVGAANVVDFVMRDEYAVFENREAERKRALADLAAALYDGVAGGRGTSTGLIRALATAGSSGHLQVFSAEPAEQAVIAPLRAGGGLPGRPGAFLEVVSNNAAGNKADYYVRRRVSYSRPRDGSARVEVQLRNLVRPGEVPAIVTGRLDNPAEKPEPGATRQIVSLYLGVGAKVRAMTVDGRPTEPVTGTERGHGWASVQVEIVPGRPTIIAADVDDPGGRLLYRQQPLVVPDELRLGVPYRLG